MTANTTNLRRYSIIARAIIASVAFMSSGCASALAGPARADALTPMHVANTRSVGSAKMSPNGEHIAYVLNVPREPFKDDNGRGWSELHVVKQDGHSRPFVTGNVNIAKLDWTPDGTGISFLAKRGDDEHKSLYVIPVDGGEAVNVLSQDTDITAYSWSPDGKRVAFLAKEQEDKSEKKLKDKGFEAEIYEEQNRNVRVWIASPAAKDDESESLDLPGSATDVRWAPSGTKLVVVLAPSSRVDDTIMLKRIHIVDADSGRIVSEINSVGKLGKVAWSPDGKHIACIAAEDVHDPSAGRLMIAASSGGDLTNILTNYLGHVRDIGWQDNDTVMYVGDEGCYTTFAKVDIDGTNRKTIVPTAGPILRSLSLASGGLAGAYIAESPQHPREVYTIGHGDKKPRRLTDSNPWIADVTLAAQEVVTYRARDGLELEGILIRPLDEQPNTRYPLILTVHGGPEANRSNGWVTRYSGGGQLAAARGFAVFYANYRGSTGRGVAFSKLSQGDYGGGEFNDLVDAITHLDSTGLIDKNRVGITGGSYGGFASAWGATKLTEHFAAAVMFVGISDQVSKFGTTDIPNEMHKVHSRAWPWDDWDVFREASPITHTPQARTPILILHGKKDTRVHPSQSLELYRYLKTLGKVPVRLVYYPNEGHGNRKAAGRYDYSLRLLRWMEHYLKTPNTRTTPPPPHELDYGFPEEDE